MTPDEIRAIRGSLSRAAFSKLLGVTALTVLRWELPDGNKEARRPRPKMIEALRKLAADGVGMQAGRPATDGGDDEDDDRDVSEALPVAVESVASHATHVDVDQADATKDEARLRPLLDRLSTDGWSRAEDELLALLSSGALITNTGRALATLGLVQAQYFGRLDVRGALAAILPILDDVDQGRLPRHIAGYAHVLAALVFSGPDSRHFSPGRVNVHVQRASETLDPGDDNLRVLLATARAAAAQFLGPQLATRSYLRHDASFDRATTPLAHTLVEELRTALAMLAGDEATAAKLSESAIVKMDRLGLAAYAVMTLSLRARRALHGVSRPEEILAITRRAKEKAEAAKLPPSESLVRVLSYECEALCRVGRLAEAEEVVGKCMDLAKRGGIPLYAMAVPAVHLYVYKNRLEDVKRLAEILESDSATSGSSGAPNLHAIHVRAVAADLEVDYARTAELSEQVLSAPDGTPGVEDLTHDALFELLISAIMLGDNDKIRSTVRRFESFLESRPSVWHSAVARRLDGFGLLLECRSAEARQKLESAVAGFALIGDDVQVAFGRLSLAVVARAMSAPDAAERFVEAQKALASYGVVPRPNFLRVLNATAGVSKNTWHEQSMAERLVIAVERITVPGLPPQHARQELESVLGSLFPGRDVVFTAAGDSDVAPWDGEWEEITDALGRLRFGVRGSLDREQRAALRLLALATNRELAATARIHAGAETDNDPEPMLPGFIAAASATRRLKRELAQLSRSSATILITGESGSGKEVVARAVHDLSARARKPYVAFNCASVPRDLFEGQLFGYKRGAFTGAATDSPGVIRAADGGTVFLDEIGELPLDTQPKLLRFLENGEVFPLGEQKPRRVDVRVLAATHRDLGRLVREGLFREDLYYRLNVVPLHVPPLRERTEDIVALAKMFIARLGADEGQGPEPVATTPELGTDAIRALEAHTWPGNVRELRNVIERAMAYAPIPQVLHAEHLRIGPQSR